MTPDLKPLRAEERIINNVGQKTSIVPSGTFCDRLAFAAEWEDVYIGYYGRKSAKSQISEVQKKHTYSGVNSFICVWWSHRCYRLSELEAGTAVILHSLCVWIISISLWPRPYLTPRAHLLLHKKRSVIRIPSQLASTSTNLCCKPRSICSNANQEKLVTIIGTTIVHESYRGKIHE